MEYGKLNNLEIARIDDSGYYFLDDENDEIFLANYKAEEVLNVGDVVEVFVYKEEGDQLLATTKKPYAQIDEFAFLKVTAVNKIGAFVDCGMPNDLMVPFAEQSGRLEEDNWYLFFILKNEKTGRLIASRKVNDFVFFENVDLEPGQEVDLLLYDKTDLGINAIINNMFKGLIFTSDIHKNINPGDRIKGYVKQVREDGKVDVVLEPMGYKMSVDKNAQIILDALKKNDGFLELTDKSLPEDIKQQLGMSKKTFKKSLGNLYKQKLVELYKDGIKLL
ncbi:MAG: S1-like domain-containing RNA-binding protein [Flavobacteriaceae bacterium]|nr:S1-like domain-containing RNA-binding protein [Flavobacteriaceae bacterium]